MRPLSYWVANPDVREYAIPLVETNLPRRQIVNAIIERFGEDVAPSCDEQVTKLRMQLAQGRWRQDRVAPPTIGKFAWKGAKTFWDNHPSITRFAAKRIANEDTEVQFAIEKRFGKRFRPESHQMKLLREGLETGRLTAAPVPKTLSATTLRLFSDDQATECLIPGVTIWTRRHCLQRQMGFRIEGNGKTWNDWNPGRQSSRVWAPQLALCVKCVNWIPAEDMRLLRRKIQKGFKAEATK